LKTESNINSTLNHLFREESGKMVSVLTKIFGSENFDLAEDVVQDALISAMDSWKFRGIPENPKAWLYQTARNKAIDLLRKNKKNIAVDFENSGNNQELEKKLSIEIDEHWQNENIDDDFLSMMFACCDPGISEENQKTFILKTLCGFSTNEIASAFLTTNQVISKRLYRTKEYFRKSNTKLEIPAIDEIQSKVSSILNVIYLVFNEGYNSSNYDSLIRKDLINQAMYLCKKLIESKRIDSPESYALMALMCFHAARSESRISSEGLIVSLSQQNRNNWNQELIKAGNSYLNKSALGNSISTFHIEAAIAYHHCVAKDFNSTDWNSILKLYDMLYQINEDPVVWVNRCIVIMELKSPEIALGEIEKTTNLKKIENYYIYHATLGEIHSRIGNKNKAIKCYKNAINQTNSPKEKKLLEDKISAIVN
jgi:RNA polymerase sigma-70 factor (ECF subfamily)